MNLNNFLDLSADRCVAILTREKALEIIKEKGLEKAELWGLRMGGELCYSLGVNYSWSWPYKKIQKGLRRIGVAFIKDELEFYATDIDPFPLFVLKNGVDKAVCVSPAVFPTEIEI